MTAAAYFNNVGTAGTVKVKCEVAVGLMEGWGNLLFNFSNSLTTTIIESIISIYGLEEHVEGEPVGICRAGFREV